MRTSRLRTSCRSLKIESRAASRTSFEAGGQRPHARGHDRAQAWDHRAVVTREAVERHGTTSRNRYTSRWRRLDGGRAHHYPAVLCVADPDGGGELAA